MYVCYLKGFVKRHKLCSKFCRLMKVHKQLHHKKDWEFLGCNIEINMEERRLPKAMRAFSTALTHTKNDTPEYIRPVAKKSSIMNEN